MKNTIKNLNTIYAYTDEALSKKNIVLTLILNYGYREVILTSSGIKMYKKSRNNQLNNYLFNKEPSKTLNREVILKDIKNFRKYFNEFSFSHDLKDIKDIFINNNISMDNLISYIDSCDYL